MSTVMLCSVLMVEMNRTTMVASADDATVKYAVPMVVQSEDTGASSTLGPSTFQATPGDIGKLSYLQALSLFNSQNPKWGKHTIYDVYENAFNMANGAITPQEAVTSIREYPMPYASTVTLDNISQFVNLVTGGITGESFDWDKITAESKQLVTLDPTITNFQNATKPFIFWLTPNTSHTVITYKTPNGVTAPATRTVSGNPTEKNVIITSPTSSDDSNLAGYVPDQKNVTVSFSQSGTKQVTVTYAKPEATATPSSVDQSSLTANARATVTAGGTVTAETFKAEATDRNGQALPVTVDLSQANLHKAGTYSVTLTAANGQTKVATLVVQTVPSVPATTRLPKQRVVYGLKTLYLYRYPTFTQATRLVKYTKVARRDRPMLIITGYDHSKAGLLRYQVKDMNRNSTSYHKTGYITDAAGFVAPVYYQKAVSQVKVIATHGVNTYRKVGLTNKVRHFKKGQVIKVIGLKHNHQTTRFVLQHGDYLTANKKMVMAVK